VLYESNLPFWLFLIPAAAALLEALIGRRRPEQAGKISIIGAILALIVALTMGSEILAGNIITAWNGQLYVDALGSLVSVIVMIVGLAATVFSTVICGMMWKPVKHDQQTPRLLVLVSLFISTMAWGVNHQQSGYALCYCGGNYAGFSTAGYILLET